MSKEIILRPVFNRPEMLYLSIEYEIAARNYYNFPDDLTTIFLIEYGSPQKTIDLVKEYPFEKEIVIRTEKFGLSKNILLGMKEAFELAGDFIIYLEDDVLVWKHYFQYIDVLLNMKEIGKFSVLSAYSHNDSGNVNEVYRGQHYAALAALITKWFFIDYIIHCINPNYYENAASRDRFVRALDNSCKKYWGKGYKYRGDGKHHAQAGVINRFADLAMIQDNAAVIMPMISRQQHIGFVGYNRPGRGLLGDTFEERLQNLCEIIKSADKLYASTDSKQYNDYKVFSSMKLEGWDGTLCLKN